MKKFILQITYGFIVKWFLRIVIGVKLDDARFLLSEQQFIIVANHNGCLDMATLMASLPRKVIHKVKPVVAADYVGKTKLRERLSNYFINTLLVKKKRDKGHPSNDPINKIIDALDEGYSLIVFPEGSRGEPGKLQPFKPGIGLILLQRPHIKYVPAYMTGRVMRADDDLFFPFNACVKFGKPSKVKMLEVDQIMKQIEFDLLRLSIDVHPRRNPFREG